MTNIGIPALFLLAILAAIIIFILGLPIVLLIRLARRKEATKKQQEE